MPVLHSVGFSRPDFYLLTVWALLQVNWWKTKNLLDGSMPPRTVSVLKFEGPRTHGMVPALEAFSEFHLTVLAYNSKGPGPESEPYVFHTPEGGEWIQMCIHIPV